MYPETVAWIDGFGMAGGIGTPETFADRARLAAGLA